MKSESTRAACLPRLTEFVCANCGPISLALLLFAQFCTDNSPARTD